MPGRSCLELPDPERRTRPNLQKATARRPMFADDTSAEPTPGNLPLLLAADLQDHLLVASNDLERLQRLLADAGDSLMAHFYGASAELKRLQQTLSAHPEVNKDELQQALTHMAGAVTAMQFQDMASQLVAHTTRRLRNCADRLASQALGSDEDGDAVIEDLPLRPNPVTQDEMDAGSVELF